MALAFSCPFAHSGDNFEQCRPCPLFDSASSADRLTCLCWRQQGGAPLLEGQVLYFNMTTEQCNAVDLGIVMRIPALLEDLNTSITRYEQSSCIPGRYCIDGVMFECPAGRYGSLYRETRPDCEGVCPEGKGRSRLCSHFLLKITSLSIVRILLPLRNRREIFESLRQV